MDFLIYAILAVTMQNGMFTRLLGFGEAMELADTPKDIWPFCLTLTVQMVLSSMLSWGVLALLPAVNANVYIRPLVYILSMIVVYAAFLALGHFAKVQFIKRQNKQLLALSMFNCSVLGALLLTGTLKMSFLRSIGFGLGSAVGFLVAAFIVLEGKRRLVTSQTADSFKGLASMLLYAGIISMALCTLYGTSLPF